MKCVIIGNGPSIKDVDLSAIDLPTFGTNAIYLKHTPTFYVIEDRLVAEDRADEINALNTDKYAGRHLSHLLTGCTWLTQVMDNPYPEMPKFTDGETFYTGGTVTYLCLQLAYMMGYTEVYLLGVDHDYTVENVQKLSANGDVLLSTGDDLNHFDKSYFGKGKRFHDPRPERMERAYEMAKLVYENDGGKIYNASDTGLLDVFERKALPC